MTPAKSEPRRNEMDWAAPGKSPEEKERARVIADRRNDRKQNSLVAEIIKLAAAGLAALAAATAFPGGGDSGRGGMLGQRIRWKRFPLCRGRKLSEN